jgi:hypothetical protein
MFNTTIAFHLGVNLPARAESCKVIYSKDKLVSLPANIILGRKKSVSNLQACNITVSVSTVKSFIIQAPAKTNRGDIWQSVTNALPYNML